MAVGYRNNAGFDFDALFQPGELQAPGFRKADGTNLRYAPRGTTTKIPDVGYRDALGSDLSNLWMARQTAPPNPGFNGQSYFSYALAQSNQTGTTSATITLIMRPTGDWEVLETRVNSFDPGTVVLASGSWLPAGAVASQFTVRFAVDAGSGVGTVTNTASSAQSLASSQSFELFVGVPANSSKTNADSRTLTTTLTRVGSGSSTSLTYFTCEATGWL